MLNNLLLTIGLCVLLSACGFQLRGTASPMLPADAVIFIDGQPGILSELAQYLPQDQLRDQPEQATVVLRLSDERFDRRVLSVNAKTGREREAELIYTVLFTLKRMDDSLLLPRQRIRIVRDTLSDADKVIAQYEEEAVLRHEMRRNAMQQIARRVQTFLRGEVY